MRARDALAACRRARCAGRRLRRGRRRAAARRSHAPGPRARRGSRPAAARRAASLPPRALRASAVTSVGGSAGPISATRAAAAACRRGFRQFEHFDPGSAASRAASAGRSAARAPKRERRRPVRHGGPACTSSASCAYQASAASVNCSRRTVAAKLPPPCRSRRPWTLPPPAPRASPAGARAAAVRTPPGAADRSACGAPCASPTSCAQAPYIALSPARGAISTRLPAQRRLRPP